MSSNILPTFLFYDYETFGINTAIDKPAQFSCIRTDIHLNIISSPQSFYCFPPADYLPDPYSILITGITPQYTYQYGTNEYYFTKKIAKIFNQPNTCILGYNNIFFDDEVTRYLFYRNFFDPYTWSWKNGNTRWDCLNLLRACYALRPNGILWPKNKLGFISFKLSDFTKKNNILHSNIHDATSDVYATIQVLKLIQRKKPKFFNFFFQHRTKKNIMKLINLRKITPVVYISSIFGAVRNNISIILPISLDENNSNIIISIDLFANIEKLIILLRTVFVYSITSVDLFKLGIILLHVNRCPMIAPLKTMRIHDFVRLNLNYDLYNQNINILKKNNFIFHTIKLVLSQKIIFQKSTNVDAQLYNSFFTAQDRFLIKKIRCSSIKNLKTMNFIFHDTRLKKLFFRYRARNFFEILNEHEKKIWFHHCSILFNASYIHKYKKNICNLLQEYSPDEKKTSLLNDTLKYFFSITLKYI